jgi:hypothetical protein
MESITAKELKEAVEMDPAWASKLKRPVVVTGICSMVGSSISHLSPLLHFQKQVSFRGCENLKRAEGKFEEFVDFEGSGLEEVGELTITGRHPYTKLRCDFVGTPLFKKNPVKALETMAGTKNIGTWQKMQNLTASAGWGSSEMAMAQTIRTAKAKKAISSLRKQGNPLEI